MGAIIIPDSVTEKQKKDAAVARVMDTKAIARQLVLNSYAGGSPETRVSPAQAFDIAEEFMAEQTRRFPRHDTATGEEKDVTHG